MSDLEPVGALEARPVRRRRSAARTPALIDPADVPEDAAGRVELIAVRAPADVLDPVEVPGPAPVETESRLVPLILAANGWVAIGVLAAVLVIVFLIGLAFTH